LTVVFLAAFGSLATSGFCQVSDESDSQVWKVGPQRWTIQEEDRYSRWVEENLTDDFFLRYGIPVDCADVAYATRWIYARIAHLPAAATTTDNRLIGHWSKAWGHLPTHPAWHKDRRFRAALMAVLSTTSTRTLPSDAYPIRIAADSVTPGTVFLVSEEHAGVVSHLVMDGSTPHPVQTLEAGLPTRVQKLHLRNFISPDPDPDHLSGLIKFRRPVKAGNRWRYPPRKEEPFYSEEQYSPAFTEGYGDYLEAVAKRIDPNVHDPDETAKNVMDALARRLRQRVPIVLDGNRKCHEVRCPEGSTLWEIYSTPDRDEFIEVMIGYLEEIIRENHLDRKAVLDEMSNIRLQISPGRFITLLYLFQNWKWLSSDPEATIEARWGLDKCGIIAVRLKSEQESIAFIQRQYGRTDPRFAERSLWIRQPVLDELIREGKKNNCAGASSRDEVRKDLR